MGDNKKSHKSGYTISTGIVVQMVEFLKTTEVDVPKILKNSGLSEEQIESLDERIAIESYIRLEDEVAKAVGDPFFGLHMGQMTEVGNWGILGYLMMNCEHVGEAFCKYAKYSDIVGNLIKGRFQVDEGKENMKITLSIPEDAPSISRHCYEGYLASLISLANTLTGKKIYPIEVGLSSREPESMKEYKEIFGEKVYFQQTDNYMLLDRQVMDSKIGMPNKKLLAYFEQYALDFINEMDQTLTFQIKKIILSYMDRSDLGVGCVAEKMGMSVRSLQQKLRQEQTDFSTIMRETRMGLGKKYLREGYSPEDITYLLGFSDVVVFRKAFKKWMGMTPKEYRISCQNA